jgi:acetylornithine deacetylase
VSRGVSVDRDLLVRLARELGDVSSPNGAERDAALVALRQMGELGLEAELQEVAPGRANALGVARGSGGGRSLLFVGHLDTGPFPAGRPVPPTRIDGDTLVGVGIWNMKGPIAAYLAAVAAVPSAGIDLAGDVLVAAVAGTHDETAAVETRLGIERPAGPIQQGYSVGTRHLLAGGVRADFGVVGEPTDFRVIERHFGLVGVRIAIGTPAGPPSGGLDSFVSAEPPAYAPTPPTALDHAGDVVRALREWTFGYEQRNRLDGWAARVSVRAIEGGSPWTWGGEGESAVFVFVGTVPGVRGPEVLAEIRGVLDGLAAADPTFRAEATTYLDNAAPSVDRDSPLLDAVRAAHADVFQSDLAATVVPWHSDASPLGEYGIPAVNYGPRGRIEFAPDSVHPEYLQIDDLVALASVYAGIIERICG